jgi:hypothetical protein
VFHLKDIKFTIGKQKCKLVHAPLGNGNGGILVTVKPEPICNYTSQVVNKSIGFSTFLDGNDLNINL